ncbi:MAG: hypothetical protein QGG40_14770 [Myxococcota bacterium]|nr:hypothetical protein [Myxococcota bacterium]
MPLNHRSFLLGEAATSGPEPEVRIQARGSGIRYLVHAFLLALVRLTVGRSRPDLMPLDLGPEWDWAWVFCKEPERAGLTADLGRSLRPLVYIRETLGLKTGAIWLTVPISSPGDPDRTAWYGTALDRLSELREACRATWAP